MASTRLTKALIDTIVEAVYKASKLPKELEALEKLPKSKFKELIEASRPPEFVEMIQGKPKEWFGSDQSTYEHRKYKDGDGHRRCMGADEIGSWGDSPIMLDDPVLVPREGCSDYGGQLGQWMYEFYRPKYQAWAKRKQKLNESTRGVLTGFRTVEQLLKQAPEFEQFIPKNHVSYPVPAVPISNALAAFLAEGIELKKAA